jgi:hypothetical protein
MIQLTYVSSSALPVSTSQLDEIVAVSRRNNTANGITGMLLHVDGSFLQILEGPAAAVEATYARIDRDPRHRGLLVIHRTDITQRAFKDWSMGFQRLSRADAPDVAWIFELQAGAVEKHMVAENADLALRLMRTFYRVNARDTF